MRLSLDLKLSRDVVKLAWPVILGMLSQTSVNLVDTILIGWMKDETVSVAGVAGIGITLPLYWAVGGFISSISVGTQAITARRFGEKQDSLAGRVLSNSLLVAFSIGILLSIAGFLLIPYVFPFFNSNPEVLKQGVPYAQYRFAAVLAMVATISYKSFFDGIGMTYIHMVASIVMNIANIVLNILLIFGLAGFPEMGVPGSGLGTCIASYIGLAIIMGWSFGPSLRKKYQYYRARNFNFPVIREVLRLSLPGGMATVVVMTGFLLFLKIVGIIDRAEWLAAFPHGAVVGIDETLNAYLRGTHGEDLLGLLVTMLPQVDTMTEAMRSPVYTAGTKVIMDLMSISFMSAIAIGTATATLVSQNLGKGKPGLAERYGWEAVKIGAFVLGGLGIAEAIFPHIFLNIFTDKQAVINAAATSLRMIGMVNFMVAAGLIFMNALFGAGNAKFVMYTEFTLHFTCLVPLAYLFGIHFKLGMEGVWLSGVVYIISLASILGWKFWQGKWKHIKI